LTQDKLTIWLQTQTQTKGSGSFIRIDQVMDNIDGAAPAYKAIQQARLNGKLNTAVVGVNKQTGQLVGVPVDVPSPH
jgi:hypothetical protein